MIFQEKGYNYRNIITMAFNKYNKTTLKKDKVTKKKLKICMFTYDFPPIPGGIANHVYELSKALIKLGHEVHVVIPRDSFKKKSFEIVEGINVHRVFEIPIKRFLNPLYIISVALKIHKIIKKEDIDIVHNHSFLYGSIITKMIRNVLIVLTNHESGYLEMANKRKYHFFLKFIMSHTNFLIAPSKELTIKPIMLGFPKKQTKFISNGVDIFRFNPNLNGANVRNKFKITKDEIVVLCPRRLAPKNGVKYFVESALEVFKKNKKIKYIIVGGGFPKESHKLQRFVDKYNLNERVIFTGNIKNKNMPAVFAAADIVILPSLIEATSLAGLEAMASGKPLIGTKVGGIPYLIEDNKTGVLIPPKESSAIATAILTLSNNKNLRLKMGKYARKRAEEEFSWIKIAKKTIEVYKSVIKNSKVKG